MKKFNEFMKWVFINVLTFGFLYLGLYCGMKGAQNVFIAWFVIQALSLSVCLSQKQMGELYKRQGPTVVPTWLSYPVEMSICGILLWYGYTGTAALSGWAWVMMMVYADFCKKQEVKEIGK